VPKPRKGLSKRLRFEIFKRDGFRCLYCGVTPAGAMLRVDHVVPVSEGGRDDPSNLVTACHDCNGGKGAVSLDVPRYSPTMAVEDVAAYRDQLQAYLAMQREVIAAKTEMAKIVCDEWEREFGAPPWRQTESAFRGWLSRFSPEELAEAIHVARAKSGSASVAFPYLCGIIRNWKTGTQPGRAGAV